MGWCEHRRLRPCCSSSRCWGLCRRRQILCKLCRHNPLCLSHNPLCLRHSPLCLRHNPLCLRHNPLFHYFFTSSSYSDGRMRNDARTTFNFLTVPTRVECVCVIVAATTL